MARSSREGPSWLPDFLTGDYFSHCGKHPSAKNERNHFCIDCVVDGPVCHIGLQHKHAGHKSLQVRRASHMDAVRVHDVQKLADISNIQTYTINGAKIVFLLSRPQDKVSRGAAHWCKSCNRSLTDPTSFCSISCKLAAVEWDASVSLALPYPLADSKENDHVNVAAAGAPARATRTCCLETEQQLVKAMAMGLTQQQKLSKAGKKALLPSKKRKIDHLGGVDTMQSRILDAGASGYGSDEESPASPISVLAGENSSSHCPESPQHSGNSHSYSNLGDRLAPSTPQKHELAGLRSRQRKGFPHRSPFA